MKNRIKFLAVMLLTFSFSAYSQLKEKDYANSQHKTFRINKMISLTSKDGNFNLAKEYLVSDSLAGDFEYYLSKSLFDYTVYGKQVAYKYLDKKLTNNKINTEELIQAKVWLALITDNTLEYKKLKKEFQELFPNSNFLYKMFIKDYLLSDSKNIHNRSEEKEEQMIKSIDSIMSQSNLSDSDTVFFSIAKLDIQKNPRYDKENSKLKKQLSKVAEKYPAEFWEPYLKFALGEDNFLIAVSEFIPNAVKPSNKEIENWTAFHGFLDDNPFFDETKVSREYLGFPIIYYPRIENEKELKIALNGMDSLIKKYPGIMSLKITKFLIPDIFKDLFSDKDQMAQQYLSILIDIFEHNGDNGLTVRYIDVKFEYDEKSLNELFSYLNESSLFLIKEQIELSLKNEPNHLNLIKLKEALDKFTASKN